MPTPTRYWAAIVALTLVACAGSTARVPVTPRADSSQALPDATLDQVRDTVMAARRLTFVGEQVEVVQLAEGDFKATVRAHTLPPSAEARGLSRVFSWAAPKQSSSAQQSKSLDELVAAYYDAKHDRIVAPVDGAGATPDKLGTFAHELQHALQQRHFDITRLQKSATDDDAKLALSALIEGDAQVTMGAYLGATHGIPTSRALRRITDLTAGVRVHHGVRGARIAGSDSPQLLTFPYDDGMRFVADLYRAGGFELVNRAYERPPTATMHILHPERYVAGVVPAVVAAPEPLGKQVASGTWGELRTIMVLAACVPIRRARAVAAGWRGDGYTLGQRGDRSTLSWVSVWSNVAAARAFQKSLHGCLRVGRRVHRYGDRVLLTVNATAAGHASRIAALAGHAVTQAPARPFGDVVVPPRVPIPARRHGRLNGVSYQSIWLGLDGQVPVGMKASVGPDLELTVLDPHSDARGVVALYDHVPRGRSLDALFDDVQRTLRATSKRPVTKVLRQSKRGALGPVISEQYQLGPATIVVEVLPLCAETGALVFVRAWRDDLGRDRLKSWRHGFRWIVDRRIPACRWLDPK
jgi:hypothetical protein